MTSATRDDLSAILFLHPHTKRSALPVHIAHNDMGVTPLSVDTSCLVRSIHRPEMTLSIAIPALDIVLSCSLLRSI